MTMHADKILRALIISPNWVGDAVLAQPLLQRLSVLYPTMIFDVLAPSWVAPVWRMMKEVDTVFESTLQHGKLQWGERKKIAKMLVARGYDRAYVLPNTLKFALIPWLAKIPLRIGYCGEMRYGLINVMHHDEKNHPRAMVQYYAALSQAPSTTIANVLTTLRPALAVSLDQQLLVTQKFKVDTSRPIIMFAPGAEFGSAKRWPPTHFAMLAGLIKQSYPYAQIILMGSTKDVDVGQAICVLAPDVINMIGATNLSEAICLLAAADAVVSNDSGILHIASALNRPLIAIYGPTDPNHAPPFSVGARSLSLKLACAPCKQRVCPLGHHRCMQDLDAHQVWDVLAPMLS